MSYQSCEDITASLWDNTILNLIFSTKKTKKQKTKNDWLDC